MDNRHIEVSFSMPTLVESPPQQLRNQSDHLPAEPMDSDSSLHWSEDILIQEAQRRVTSECCSVISKSYSGQVKAFSKAPSW